MKNIMIFYMSVFFSFSGLNVFGQWNSDYYHGVVRPAVPFFDSGKPVHSVRYSSKTSENSRGVTHAILMGINHYDGKLNTLSGCVNDVHRVKEWLENTHQVKSDRMVMLTERDASYENFHFALQKAKNLSCDRLIVVLACHGGSAYGKSFICPQNMVDLDFRGVNQEDILNVFRQKNLVPLSEILDLLKNARAKDVLLVLDSCRNTQTGDESFMQEFQELMKNDNRYFQKKSGVFAVITSCSFGQKAEEYSSSDKDYGKFLYFFTEGLTGKADYAGCYDNQVTLTEAYNYAYSRMGASQTPEIFMASSSGNMVLARYEDIPRPEDPQKESDLAFLLRTGVLLSNIQRWSPATNKKGLQALDCVLENIPNNVLACSVRGSVHRRLGNYGQALLDWDKVGQKLQVYAGRASREVSASDKGMILRNLPGEDAQTLQQKISSNDLLTISGVRGDYLKVSEVNNIPVNPGWIHRDYVHWDFRAASAQTTATRVQRSRTYSSSAAPMERLMMTTQPGRGGGQRGPIAGGP
ncbi:MAG: caspase family protein [Planctomycetia bacterium]|nr:caspase family protein [Planctomycetia bacterium]